MAIVTLNTPFGSVPYDVQYENFVQSLIGQYEVACKLNDRKIAKSLRRVIKYNTRPEEFKNLNLPPLPLKSLRV